ncbi:T9SS type A sorting domain-containing protein [Ferruginibacter sp.]
MRKSTQLLLLQCMVCAFLAAASLVSCNQKPSHRAPLVIDARDEDEEEGEEDEKYDNPDQLMMLDFQKMKDPALGYVPYDRLKSAIDYTNSMKQNAGNNILGTLLWVERGPIYDSVGPSNGNTRGGNGYTSGRMAAILVDTLNDPTGNTVIVGGVSGGVWKCTNFLSPIANWYNVNDYFANMAISSICQDPSNPSIMYFSTGEATSNADAHFGAGIWKSTDKGETWTQLPSTSNFMRNFKILCDAAGNVYVAARITTTPLAQPYGLLRSNDKGVTWTNITPTGLTSTNAHCTDIEISSTGRLHASFGYLGTVVNHRYTTTPATVTTTTGWNVSTGLRTSGTAAIRLELACLADTLYGVTVTTAYNSDSCYRSIDGGATWTKQNTTVMPTGVLSGQGWYNETLAINPANSAELICGGLDAYRSTNAGATWTRQTYWVTTIPYVHADHHFMQWIKKGNEGRVYIGCDGGIFYSNDGGVSWVDKNRNLSLKQFYACAIHPAAGSSYLLAGAQDNGCHQLKNPGLSYSTEVTGGDGMYVYINQQDPNIQFGSYVYNQYRRSTNGGQTWTSVNLNTTQGLFANPFDYDDGQNIMYACNNANQYRRWLNANTAAATTSTTVTVNQLNGGQAGALKMSPYTANRLYLGGTTGKIVRVDDANGAAPTMTDITGTSMPAGYINTIAVGSSDNFLVATFTNYGVNNVWYSSNGGTSWTAIDGNLPDMPVWSALFDPTDNNSLIIGTETGVYTTNLVNGASTQWTVSPGFPTTRVSMLRLRASDKTIVAASYGRGLFTAQINNSTAPEVSFVTPVTNVTEQTSVTSGCRGYKDYTVNVGIINPPTGDATVNFSVQASSTALEGVDFDFTTNGSFTAPSKQIVFTNGLVAIKPITIRVYDDVQVEPSEFFTLGFTISGTTNAVAGITPLHTFNIADNDVLPVALGSANYTIGTYNTDMTSLNTPFDGTKLKHRVQVLYTAAELQAAGIIRNAVISSLTLRVKTKNTTQPFKGFTVSMANTANTNLGAGFAPETLTPVYTSDYSTVVGNNVFNFTTPFVWNGTSNLVVQFCFDNSPGTAEGVTDVVEGIGAPLGTGVRASTYSNWTTATGSGCTLAAAFIDDNRVNATLLATFGSPVATALNSTKTEFLGGFNDLFYYTPTGEILARILNLSGQNYGCTQVLIDRAGNGTSQFWNTNPANYLMNKTYQVLPTTNSTTGKYEITFYFTAAEKQGWEAATGQVWDSIKMIKLPSRISNVTPLITQPDGPGTVEVVNPVRRTFGANYYTLSFIFENGFSGFGFGVPGKMNTLLNLNGHFDANGKDIDLDWTTSVEINSLKFEVEKSYDGVNFTKRGTVSGAGYKLTPSSYAFVDHEVVQTNYFRIKMIHTDGSVIYSNVVLLQKNDIAQGIIVLPNPFSNTLGVRFKRLVTGPVTLSLYDNAGKLVKRVVENTPSMNYTMSTTDILSSAVYILKVNVDGQKYSAKVLKN